MLKPRARHALPQDHWVIASLRIAGSLAGIAVGAFKDVRLRPELRA